MNADRYGLTICYGNQKLKLYINRKVQPSNAEVEVVKRPRCLLSINMYSKSRKNGNRAWIVSVLIKLLIRNTENRCGLIIIVLITHSFKKIDNSKSVQTQISATDLLPFSEVTSRLSMYLLYS